MVWNQKLAFRIFLAVLIIIFVLIFYFVFIDKDGSGAEQFFGAIGFESTESADDNPAVPLPSSGGSSAGSSMGSSGGSGGSGIEGSSILRFCTFDAYHTITSDVPCRCGFSGVCYQPEGICDATFNNGEGLCS
ncbi:MAG: hypothetical protein AABX10_04045 [Nanoarchaeota archaeon]